jgi:protein-S-isoprenylcysteine O-methyltransferase Ste14
MTKTLIGLGLILLIWLINGIYIIQGIKNKVRSEVYMHCGLGLFFSLAVILSVWGKLKFLWSAHYDWLATIGLILYLPAFILVMASLVSLKHQGKSRGTDMTATTVMIRSGIYRLIRQPMTLGLAIWSIGLILILQSLAALTIGLLAIFCFFQSARLESKFNQEKFGAAYIEYMETVPRWNLFRGLRSIKEKKMDRR